MNLEIILILAGLSEREAAIYKALLEYGPATVAEISRVAKLFRPAIYKTVPGMFARGIISKRTSGKRTHYVPSPPEMFLPEIEKMKTSLDATLVELNAAYRNKSNRPKVLYYEGAAGVARTYSDVLRTLKKGDVYYRYSTRGFDTSDRYRPKNFTEERTKKGLQWFVITSKDKAKNYHKNMDRAVKTVPHDVFFDDNIQFIIYGDKISIADYESETGIIIEHKKLASFQRKVFKLLFDRL